MDLDLANPDTWLRLVQSLVVFLMSLTVHEYAHARVAFWLGDDTASRQGRLTLNPISHIDPIGTILMPIIGAFSPIAVIGWAKPVPVNPTRLSRRMTMRGGMALVAAAGPASNLVLAVVCVGLFWLVFASGLIPRFELTQALEAFLRQMIFANVGLAVFNMLPIPPLDGSRLMPRSLDGVMEFVGRYSFVFFLLVMFAGSRFLIYPVLIIVYVLFLAVGIDTGLVNFLFG